MLRKQRTYKICPRYLTMCFLICCLFFVKAADAVLLSSQQSTTSSHATIHIHASLNKQVINYHQAPFFNQISAIPPTMKQQMQLYTWHSGCPVSLSELAYVQLSYWGFDNKSHQGVLIVNSNVAKDIVAIFKQLYIMRFPIAKMQPLDVYYGSDMQSMMDNNTVAFNCRALASNPYYFSRHSYGTAIDINPLFNPYVNGYIIAPPQGKFYLARHSRIKGTITHGSAVYAIFIAHGWKWGGDWQGLKDYQHFEKDN